MILRRIRWMVPLLVAAVSPACSTSSLWRPFSAGEYLEVTRTFEADSSLHDRQGELYLAALAYALPESEAHDPQRALAALERLITMYPRASRAAHARHLFAIVSENERLANEKAEAERLLREATSALDEERSTRTAVVDSLATLRTRADGLQSIADQLARELQARNARIAALEEELAALKEIDLNRPPPVDTRPPAGPPDRP